MSNILFKGKPVTEAVKNRFLSKVKFTANSEKCWEWGGTIHKSKYGYFTIGSVGYYSHRMSYFIHTGVNPEDLDVLHKCDNTKCVNPNHLFLGTHLDNMKDMKQKGRVVSYKGSKKWNSKLTEAQVVEIKERYKGFKVDGIGFKELANEYNVSIGLISHIMTGLNWRHVK